MVDGDISVNWRTGFKGLLPAPESDKLSIVIEHLPAKTAKEKTWCSMNDIATIFKALSDATRLAVFQCIRCCGDETCYDVEHGCCCPACEEGVAACRVRCKVPCAPSTLSHHLNELRAAGLITTEKRGRVVYCRVCPEALGKIDTFVKGK